MLCLFVHLNTEIIFVGIYICQSIFLNGKNNTVPLLQSGTVTYIACNITLYTIFWLMCDKIYGRTLTVTVS